MALSGLVVGGFRPRGQTRRPDLPTVPLVATRTLNHVSLRVADARRSLEFYQRVFGMPVRGYQKNGQVTLVAIGSGPQFLSLFEGPTPQVSDVGFGVEDFDAERLRKILADKGIEARLDIRRAAEQRPARETRRN
jgi:catechol 2,3-dioxygenase-like lactoylglutathione lyase family enzyme